VADPRRRTNNGLIHVLDKVMSPNGTAPSGGSQPSSTGTGTGTGTGGTPTPTGSSRPNAGSALSSNGLVTGVLALAASMVLFF